MPCEREIQAIETELLTLAKQHGVRVSGANWTHKPGGAFRLTVTTGQGNQTLDFPLPEVAEYFHKQASTRDAVQTRLKKFVDALPVSAPSAQSAGTAPSDAGHLSEATADLLSEAVARIKAIEMVLIKKGLTSKEELTLLAELIQGAHRSR